MAVITEDERTRLIRYRSRMRKKQQEFENEVVNLLLEKGFNPSQFTIDIASGEIVKNPQQQMPEAPTPPAEPETPENGQIPESEVGEPE